MQQITIRGIDPEIERKIRSIARENGKSINQVLKEIIHKEFAQDKNMPGESLRNLAGSWTTKDAREFENAISSCEQIDEEMWK